MKITPENVEWQYRLLLDGLGARKTAVLEFVHFLETETSWLDAPASTRFHLNVRRGLLIHSVGVARRALELKNLLAPDIDDESVIITGLFHDIGKVGMPGKPYYLPNHNSWEVERRGKTFTVNPEIVTMNIAQRSLFLIANRVPLSEMEAQAIVSHDGIYPVYGGVVNLEYYQSECRLQLILHFSDRWTAAVDEEERA